MPNPTSIAVLDATSASQTISTMDALLAVFGALADAAAANGASASAMAYLRAIKDAATDTSTASPVKIDQTTDGTTNKVSVVVRNPSYKTVAASTNVQLMGATGAVGDILSHLVIIPTSTSPGAVSIVDGNILSVPTLNAPSTATTGGTLAAATYYYKVTALGASGETIASNEVSQATANLAVPTLNAPSTATTGGTLAAATYYYKVTALGASGETIASNEVSQATTGTTSTVSLSWNAIAGATGYRVYRGTAAAGENVYYAPGNVTSYTDTGAANTAGSPPGSNTAVSSTNTVSLSWTAVTGATGYRVYRGTAAAGENVYYAPGNVTSYTDTGAANTAGSPPASNTATSTAPITIFAGGASSVTTLIPFSVPLGLPSINGAWRVTTGANVSAIGAGKFS